MKSGEHLSFLHELQKECGGSISFDRYMQEALYHPHFGYYSAKIQDVGPTGDFSTSATLDEGLPQAIAAWITARAKALGWRRIPVIEIGAGSGTLTRAILRQLNWRTSWRIDYMIHETSPVLKKNQEELLRWKGVRWISCLSDTLEKSGGRALIFSNELGDAFPSRLFQKRGREWQEISLQFDGQSNLSEIIMGSAHADPWFAQFDHLPEGQRIERIDSYQSWLKEWSTRWKEGALLTIDYGDTADRLYDRKPQGSLRAYWRHQRLTGRDLYARFGKQDLTSDVNFSDLIQWGKDLNWKHRPLMTQREFEKLYLPESKFRSLSARFTQPGDAGDAFKVLEQTPGAGC